MTGGPWDAVRAHHDALAVAAHAAAQGDDPAAALAAAYEDWTAEIRAAKSALERAREARDAVAARLEYALGEGEVALAPSGRVAYLGRVAGGKATVRRDAVDERAATLPENLRPRMHVAYPTVTAVRDALKAGEITRETHDALLDVPEPAWGLKFRTLEGEVAS